MNILLLEDQEDQIELFKDNIETLEEENKILISLTAVKNINEFKNYLFNEIKYDAIIIDLKLGSHTTEYEGNDAFKLALEHAKCILYIYSATIEHTDDSLISKYINSPFIKKYDREQLTIKQLLIKINEIYKTGITNYLSSKDSIDTLLNDLFWNETSDLVEYLQENSPYNSSEIIKNYLGIALETKIIESLNETETNLSGELMYISPQIKKSISTGSIIKYDGNLYCIITPACNISQSSSIFLHLIEIIDEKTYLIRRDKKNELLHIKDPTKNKRKALYTISLTEEISPNAEGKKVLQALNDKPKGNTPYFAIPKGIFINKNMILDFHHITTIDCSASYTLVCHIHNRITKDIIALFNGQFIRQGSPEYDYKYDYNT